VNRLLAIGGFALASLALAIAILMIAAVFQLSQARAQDHNHPAADVAIHEKFYADWLRPDENMRTDGARVHSCCNNKDCAPVDAVEHKSDGTIWMLRHADQRWILVPPEKLEHSYPDQRQSPDIRAHMCSSGNTVFCAVLGGGV